MQLKNLLYKIKLIIYFFRKAKWLILITILFFSENRSIAQNLLSRSINMPAYQAISLQQLFDEITQKEGIYFSYNSNLLNVDSTLNINKYVGPVEEYMSNILGSKYFFKESGKHLIITYGPLRMGADIDWVTNQKKNGMIIGVIRDIRTNKSLANASVYDRLTFQSATLSNQDGYFELNLKYPEKTVSITLSKENYKDTTITLILPIEIKTGKEKSETGYYGFSEKGNSLYDSFFGSMFTNSRQQLQSMNLGGFFAYSPFQVSLTPGLSTHGFINSQVVNKFSLNIIGGSTAGVRGFEMAGIFNVNQYHVNGTQVAGVLNVVGGNVKGLQMAGVGNIALRNSSAVQIAGVWNNTDTLKGLQIAGITNIAKTGSGSQIAGALNISKDEISNQITGGVNIAKKVKGIQLAGLLNIADSSDYPIAVFNFIKNGRKLAAVQIDESTFLSANFSSGGRVLYSNLGIGTFLDNSDSNGKYGLEFGLGGNIILKPNFSLSAEINQRHFFNNDFKSLDYSRTSLRIIPSYIVAQKLHFFIAPSFNYSEVENPNSKSRVWRLWDTDKERNTFHGGLSAGLFYKF